MSANVWFEEVNMGLINEILRCVKVVDPSGSIVPISKDSIVVRKPEEDFKIEVFPCVSIYNNTYRHNTIRYDPNPIRLGYDEGRLNLELQDPSVPFDLSYQIDFWARYQTDMDCMTRTWLTKHFRQFNLEVVEDEERIDSCNCITKGSIVRSDLVLNKERLFHSIVTLEIWVELNDQIRYNVPVVIDRNIRVSQRRDD